MSTLLALAIGCWILALIPAVIFSSNLRLFRRFPVRPDGEAALHPVSVLIPARNEALTIASSVSSVLANRGVDFELIVLDDHSADETAAIVRALAQTDDRVRLIDAPPLPDGWCGKQHACQILAQEARFDTLLWLDADVKLACDAVARLAGESARNRAALISGFPFQKTHTGLEILLIPLMHFLLLGFLPLRRMRESTSAAYGAGCGQLFIARRKDYFEAGGHAAIRASLHDGIALPRAFRRAGKQTDLFDASDIAECRMYDSASAVWHGLLKNAAEGIGSPAGIIPWTVLLLGGQVLPTALILLCIASHRTELFPILLVSTACASGMSIRIISARRFYERADGLAKHVGPIAHPFGVLLLLVIQWQSLFRRFVGYRSIWKGRSY